MENLIKEIIGKYGKDDEISPERAEFNWNHCVTAFRISGLNKRLWSEFIGKEIQLMEMIMFILMNFIVMVNLQSKIQTNTGTLYVEKEELTELISNLAKWLMPNEIKARKNSC